MQNSQPFVLKNAACNWPARKWTPEILSEILGSKLFRFRLGPRRHTVGKVTFETDCQFCTATIAQFLKWFNSDGHALEKESNSSRCSDDNPFRDFHPATNFAYLDYKYMFEVFDECEDRLPDVAWNSFGLDRDGLDSTLWMGTKGAFTPCHYDSYGFNLVVQIFGRKRWTLFPPEASDLMQPLRLPYEESSVFAGVDLLAPWASSESLGKTSPWSVVLEPGDLLYVPNHWWHFVQCLDDGCISVNTWVDLEADNDARLLETITRCMVGLMTKSFEEELLDKEVDFQDSLILLNKLLNECENSEFQNNDRASLDREPFVKKVKSARQTGDEFLKKFLNDSKSTSVLIPILSFDEFCSLMKNETVCVVEDFKDQNQDEHSGEQKTTIDAKTFLNALLHPSTVEHLKNLLLKNVRKNV